MFHRRLELIDDVLEGDVDAERTGRDASAAFRKVSLAIHLIRVRLADPDEREGVAADAPACRAISRVNADRAVQRTAPCELVRRDGGRTAERDADRRHPLDAGAQRERRAAARSEG